MKGKRRTEDTESAAPNRFKIPSQLPPAQPKAREKLKLEQSGRSEQRYREDWPRR